MAIEAWAAKSWTSSNSSTPKGTELPNAVPHAPARDAFVAAARRGEVLRRMDAARDLRDEQPRVAVEVVDADVVDGNERAEPLGDLAQHGLGVERGEHRLGQADELAPAAQRAVW